MDRRFSASSQSPNSSVRRPSFSSSASSLSPLTPPHQTQQRQLSPDRLTPPPPPLLGLPTPASVEFSASQTASMQQPHHPWHLQGPQPISPPPAPPQISAAELLTLTEASATQSGTYQCSICAKQFGYKNGLIRHVRLTHVGEKPYQCSICNRRFGYKHILLEHQNLHFGNRPYVCGVCDKRFAARSNLIQHQMVHKRPFNCTLCSRRFDREEQLKKHLFVHPDVCRYGVDPHQAPAAHTARGHPYAHYPANGTDDYPGGRSRSQRRTETTTAAPLPDSSQEHLPPGVCSAAEQPMARLQSMADGHHGNRIDAICCQLSLQGMAAVAAGNLTIKQEVVDSTEDERVERRQDEDRGQQQFYRKQSPSEAVDLHRSSKLSSSSFSACSSSSSSSYSFKDPYGRPLRGPGQTPGSLTSPGARSTGAGTVSEQGSAWDKETITSSALPGIHEVFSRRAKAQELPSFANFMPLPVASSHLPLPTDLALKTRHHHQPTVVSNQTHPSSSVSVGSSSSSSVVHQATTPGGGCGGQRPTAQLPPITNPASRQTKDQAIQHSLSIAGFPSLDDVLAYYTSQGRLFKCQHCNILFFERGMYFLHASLHGLTSPWECSICHKVCSDKNEFTLHFVNQQHSS